MTFPKIFKVITNRRLPKKINEDLKRGSSWEHFWEKHTEEKGWA